MFTKANKKKQKLRLLLEGASGSGKTYSALLIAKALGKKIAVIDTEKGSASLYDKLIDFDTCELEAPFTPEKYMQAIIEAEKAGYDVLIIDSITHEWSGKGGCLDIQNGLGGRYQDWAKVTPRHNAFIESILQSKMHIIATARTKADYETTNKDGKLKVEKVGLKTEQRDGLDFEFTLVFRINENHIATATKDRTSLFNGLDSVLDEQTGDKILGWLNDGDPVKDYEQLKKEIDKIKTIEKLDEYCKDNVSKAQNRNDLVELYKQRKSTLSEDLSKFTEQVA